MALSALTTRGGGSSATPPASDGSRGLARQRSFDSPASADRDRDPESNALSRSALSTPKGHAQGRAIGSLAHLAAVAMKRKSVLIRAGLAFALILWIAAEAARRLLAPDHCETLPSTAPVAVLLAGSFDVFNRTHCSFTRRVIEPLRARGHPVVVFAAFDDAVDERTRADALAAMAHLRRRVPGVETRVERASSSRRFDSGDVEDETTPPSSSTPSSSSPSSSSSFVGASALNGARDDVESSAYDFAPPASCVSALASRFDPTGAASPRPAGERVRRSNEDADGIVDGVGHDPELSSRSGSDDRAAASRELAFLRALRARAQANRMRREHERATGTTFAWVVSARPDVAFADDLPTDRMCAVPGGRRVHAPWFHSRGGMNDRFAMGPPEGMSEYAGLYDATCGGASGGAAASDEDRARSIPANVDSTERVYAWHMRRRHVSVDRWALFHFVFYRARRGVPLDDRESPDARLGFGAFNPSASKFADVVDEQRGCPLRLKGAAAWMVDESAAARDEQAGDDAKTTPSRIAARIRYRYE